MNLLNKISICIPFCLFLHSIQAFAAKNTYTCVVKDVREASDKGLLVKPTLNTQMGMNFIIKKSTGEVVGEHINSEGMVSEVLDKGGFDNSYKVLIRKDYDPSFKEITYIEIRDFSYHRTFPLPFIGFRFSQTISGFCE